MTARLHVANELANVFKILAHRDRIRIIETLRVREYDVNGLSRLISLPATRVSQHLALMRAHRMVEERRAGRHVYYSLTQPDLAHWIIDGLQFIEARATTDIASTASIKNIRSLWANNTDEPR